MTGFLSHNMSQRFYDSFNWISLAKDFFMAGFPPLAPDFAFKNKLKSPAKIKFFLKLNQNFLNVRIGYSALYKFIKRKTALLILTLELIFDHHYQFFDYSQENYVYPYKKLKCHTSLSCCEKRRYCH